MLLDFTSTFIFARYELYGLLVPRLVLHNYTLSVFQSPFYVY